MQQKQDAFLIIKNHRKDTSPDFQPYIKRRKPTLHSWSDQEHLQYIKFFQQNSSFVSSSSDRKTNKIFVTMTQYIPTRTSIQIKSHHQKLIQKFKTIPAIIEELYRYVNMYQTNKTSIKRQETSQTFSQEQSEQFLDGSSCQMGQIQENEVNGSGSSVFYEIKESEASIFNVLSNHAQQIHQGMRQICRY